MTELDAAREALKNVIEERNELKKTLKSLIAAYDIPLNKEMKRTAMYEAKEMLRENDTSE